MSNEEMNKKMEFIVDHQAKFAVDIETVREVQAKAETQLQDLSRAVITVVGLVGELTEAQMRTDERLNSLADSVDKLTQAQLRTDERLNNLINVVERHIAGNGGAANPS
jgi:peptidoglycan hydrolase CwlO-like protein